jgi:hypothetical protein
VAFCVAAKTRLPGAMLLVELLARGMPPKLDAITGIVNMAGRCV